MTYKEKYHKDHKNEKVRPDVFIHCPYSFGYENIPEEYSEGECIHPDIECEECWDREIPEIAKKSEEKVNKPKSNFPGFEVNDIVMLRNGTLCIVLPSYFSEDNKSIYEIGENLELQCVSCCINYKEHRHIDNYKHNRLYDVIRLWRLNKYNAHTIMTEFFLKRNVPSRDPIWKETPPKKMTKAEIEEKLGYPIEIVESHNEDEEE